MSKRMTKKEKEAEKKAYLQKRLSQEREELQEMTKGVCWSITRDRSEWTPGDTAHIIHPDNDLNPAEDTDLTVGDLTYLGPDPTSGHRGIFARGYAHENKKSSITTFPSGSFCIILPHYYCAKVNSETCTFLLAITENREILLANTVRTILAEHHLLRFSPVLNTLTGDEIFVRFAFPSKDEEVLYRLAYILLDAVPCIQEFYYKNSEGKRREVKKR